MPGPPLQGRNSDQTTQGAPERPDAHRGPGTGYCARPRCRGGRRFRCQGEGPQLSRGSSSAWELEQSKNTGLQVQGSRATEGMVTQRHGTAMETFLSNKLPQGVPSQGETTVCPVVPHRRVRMLGPPDMVSTLPSPGLELPETGNDMQRAMCPRGPTRWVAVDVCSTRAQRRR